jgi:hypothetical protein
MERLELMKKYGINNNPIVDAQKQLDKFKSILEDPQKEDEEEIQKFEVDREEDMVMTEEVKYQENIVEETKKTPAESNSKKVEKNDDPIIAMFKNVKRNREFSVSINYENKIPRADFIEMMEDSYNTSIIEFLADEFTNQILENPNLIRDKIIAEIKKIVYKGEEVVETEKKSKEIELDAKIETKIVEKPKRGRTKKVILENDRSTVN